MLEAYEEERDRAKALWSTGLSSEVGYWDQWIASGYGGSINFEALLDPNRPLDPEYARLISPPAKDVPIKILDVGAGPLTALGPKWEGRDLEVFAVDPLADEYRSALEKKGVVPPTWTQRCDAEQLTSLFPENEFDFVFATNCLDHSYDPLEAFTEMVKVLKPGCWAVLRHAQNEAVAENYGGLHQWNFDVLDGEFVLWRPGLTVFVHDALAELAHVDFTLSDYRPGRKWILLRFQKLAEGEPRVKRVHASLTVRTSPASTQPPASDVPLRYQAVDELNGLLKRAPFVQRALKRLVRGLLRQRLP